MCNRYELPLDEHLRVYQDLECAEVRSMHDKFNFDRRETPKAPDNHHDMTDRAKMMQEEVDEFCMAAIYGDVIEMADALIDLVYFAKGTAVILGIPWGALWNDVHQCNMRKIPGEKEGREGVKQDLIKPPGWTPPRTRQILLDHGFKEED